jgi:hypothetical protein
MSIRDFVPVTVNVETLQNSPELIQVRTAGTWTPEETATLNSLEKLMNLNSFLSADPDLRAARDSFARLSPAIQRGLLDINPEAEYAKPDKNFLQKVFSKENNYLLQLISDPLRSLEKVGTAYIGAVENTALNIMNVGSKQRELMRAMTGQPSAIEQITSKDFWKDGWNGYNKWNQNGIEKLDEEYNNAIGVLARGIIDGKSYYEIFKEYGAIDDDMANAFFKVGTPEFQEIVDRYRAKKINLGTLITDWANGFAPYKENPTTQDTIKDTLASAVLSIGGMRGVKRNEKTGEFETEKLFGKGFGDPSTGLDIAATFYIDPLTYMTMGGSRSLNAMKSARTAEELANAVDLQTKVARLDDLFKEPQWIAKNQSFIQDVNVYREALDNKETINAANARLKISIDHPEYDDDVLLGILTKATVKKEGEEVLVTDLDTYKSFLQTGEYTNYIINGKVNNLLTMREESVALQNRQRRMINGMRSGAAKIFQGLDRDVVIGKKQLDEQVTKNWEDLEQEILKRPVIAPDQAVTPQALAEIERNEALLQSLTKPKKYQAKEMQRAFGELLARMPSSGAQIFWSDALVDKGLPFFRDYARLVTGDKMRAEFLTQLYKKSSVTDRINIMFNLDKIYLDSIGAAFTAEGLNYRNTVLQSRYMPEKTASIVDYTVETSDVFKAFDDVNPVPPGPSALFHTTEGITLLQFDTVIKDIYDRIGGAVGATKFKYGKSPVYKDLIKKLGYMGYGWSTNNSVSRAINRGFSFALLFPKLGIKAAFDEATVLANVTTPAMLFDLLYGKGRQLTNIHAAVTGSNISQGFIKEKFLDLIGKNPAKFRSAEQRKADRAMKEIETEYVDPDTGQILTQTELITADEFFGMSPDEYLVRAAIAKYGSKLDEQEIQYLIEDYMLDGNAADAMVGSIIGATFGEAVTEANLARQMYGASPLTLAIESKGLEILGKPVWDKFNKLKQAERNLAHYKYFYLLFSKNEKYGINLSDLFIQNNALRTERDVETFVKYAMGDVGWNATNPKPDLARMFNDRFGQVSTLRAMGMTEREISEALIVNAAKEMRYVFHGSGEGFNEDLFKLIQDKIWDAKKKVSKSRYYEDKKMAEREAISGPSAGVSKAEVKRRLDWERKQLKPSTQVGNITFEEFEKATANYPLKGQIQTDINFDDLGVVPERGRVDRIMVKGWEFMDRQVNDIIRSDVYRLKVLDERKKLKPDQEMLVKTLIDNGSDADIAAIQASAIMANQARHNSANTILKYVDNPEIRSQLAFNFRVVGRFIRATEDFAKRAIRWVARKPDSIPWRLGHLSHATTGSGITYDDQDGNKYVVIPNDGIFWQDIAPAIVMLANPPYAAQGLVKGIKDGNWGFFKQAEWNQYTMKVSLLNPSYSEGAGLYTFTGPNIAIPIAGIRDFLVGVGTKLQSKEIYNFGLSIDNILLGEVSDNTNLFRATIPPAFANYYKALTGDYKDNQGVIAAYQAISYMQYNPETAKTPADFLNAKGEYDPSKAQEFLDEWRIQTANVLAQKAAFNTIFGAPLELGQPGIPPYMRDYQTITLTKDYGDILRGLLQFNQENGFIIEDPYSVAVSLHAQYRPGKLIFQVPKGLNESKVAINYSKETLDWAIQNRKFIEKYPTAAWTFAPNVGEYDPKVITYMQAADLLPPNENPFDWNNKALKDYIERTTVAKLMSEYYQYDKNVDRLLNDPNNPNRNFVDYRKEVRDKANAEKERLLNTNPLLRDVFGTRKFLSLEGLRTQFLELKNIVDKEEYPAGISKANRDLIKTMVRSSNELYVVMQSNTIDNQYMGNTVLQQQVDDAYERLNKLASTNAYLSQAWSGIIRPMLDKAYNTPMSIVRKPGD